MFSDISLNQIPRQPFYPDPIKKFAEAGLEVGAQQKKGLQLALQPPFTGFRPFAVRLEPDSAATHRR